MLLRLLALCLATTAALGQAHPKKDTFEVGGHPVALYDAGSTAKAKPWVWYAPTLKGGIGLMQHTFYTEAWLKAGISIAGYDLGEVRGAPASTEQFTAFYDAMVARGYSTKPILLGQSRGGMMTLAWAFRHPEKLRAWAGIYPVCNLTSWPLKNSKDATLKDFALPEDQIRARLKEFNPVDNLAGLAAAKVPMFSVHGDSDVVVPHAENSVLLKERYEALGGALALKIVPGEGHKVGPSFFECVELRDFVLKQALEK